MNVFCLLLSNYCWSRVLYNLFRAWPVICIVRVQRPYHRWVENKASTEVGERASELLLRWYMMVETVIPHLTTLWICDTSYPLPLIGSCHICHIFTTLLDSNSDTLFFNAFCLHRKTTFFVALDKCKKCR